MPIDLTATTTWAVTTSTGSLAQNISITNLQSPATVRVASSATPGSYTIIATYSPIPGETTFTKTASLTVT
jgi:hypothetical protein